MPTLNGIENKTINTKHKNADMDVPVALAAATGAGLFPVIVILSVLVI
jgi:hypothetical protein